MKSRFLGRLPGKREFFSLFFEKRVFELTARLPAYSVFLMRFSELSFPPQVDM